VIQARVPAGATSGPITVVTAAGPATSAAPFTVTAGDLPPATTTTAAETTTSASTTTTTTTTTTATTASPGAPSIAGTTPRSAAPGATVYIVGSELGGATSVTFGGVAASFNVSSGTIAAVVPASAATGPVVVTTPSGTAQSPAPFTVTR